MAKASKHLNLTSQADHEPTAYEVLAGSKNGAQRCLFVDHYVTDPTRPNEALKAAGYKTRKADRSKRVCQLLSDPTVAAAVAQKMSEREERTNITQDRVLNELAVLGFSDLSDYDIDPVTGFVTLKAGVPEQAWRALSKIKSTVTTVDDGNGVRTTRITELTPWDKPKALLAMMKHLGMLDSRLKVEPEVTTTQVWKIGDREIRF